MKELLGKFLMYFCFAGIGAIAVVAFVRVTLPAAATKARSAARKAKKTGPVVIIPILCVAGMILYGSTKSNFPTNDPPAQTQMASQSSIRGELQVEKIVADALGARPLQSTGVASTQSLELNEAQPTNSLVRVEKWWRRGAYNDGQVLMFDEDWCFPYGTNHLTSVEVWASGAVYPPVNEGGTYYFLLPVFEEHELHCWPYPELVRYEIDDGYTGEGTSYRLSCSPRYSSRMMARSRTRTSSGSNDLHDGTFSVEPLVVTDPPRIPVRVAENATVSSFWNVSSVSSLTWTDQQGEVEFADATAPSREEPS